MNKNVYKLLDYINRQNDENWGLVEDIKSTKDYFGTEESVELKGKWLYMYVDSDDFKYIPCEGMEYHTFKIETEMLVILNVD